MTAHHTTHQKLDSLLVAFIVLGAIALFALRAPAFAAGSMPLSGYAWSSNAGWISFSGSGYGVYENADTRVLSGYAWSSNLGWISFSASDASHPAAVVDFVSGNISGWARACAAFADKNLCSGALDGNTGGWDGWIALSGTATNGSAYGVTQADTCAWSGYAWGSDSIGWISMSGTAQDGSHYGVTGNDASVCTHSCTAALSASPTTVNQGQNVTLTWSVTGGSACASSCTGSGFNTNGAISGSATSSVPPSPPTTSYALTCTAGTYGPPPPANATVTVIAPSVTSFTVNGQTGTVRVDPAVPNNVSVAWSSADATSCSVTKNGSAWRSGVQSAGVSDSVTAQTTYAIDCVNNYGTHATASVIVNVTPGFKEF